MRHGVWGRKLNRSSNERKRLFRNLTRSLVLHGQMTTTIAKAKSIQPYVEKLVTRAKNNTLTNKRLLLSELSDEKIVVKLLEEIAPLFKNVQGGYTRIIKKANRLGDNSIEVLISFTKPVKNSAIVKKEVKKEGHARDKSNKTK